MQTIRINQVVTDQGIFIPIDKVKDFKNKFVEIIISPFIDQKKTSSKGNDFMRFAGSISENDALEMQSLVNECRKIDYDEWK
jgi:hypothetical protein